MRFKILANHCVFAHVITGHRYKTGERNAKIITFVVFVVVESTSSSSEG